MVDLLYDLISLLFFDIPLLYYIIIFLCYYINLRLSIIFSHFSGDIYLSLSISSWFVTQLFCTAVLEALVILSAISFPSKSPVASAVFWIALFEAVLSASVADYLTWSRSFWLYLLVKILLVFLLIFLPIFLVRVKNP